MYHYTALQHTEPVKVHVEILVELLTCNCVRNIGTEPGFEIIDKDSEYTFDDEESKYTENHEQEEALVIFKVEKFKY
jgi:hypothetical protein